MGHRIHTLAIDSLLSLDDWQEEDQGGGKEAQHVDGIESKCKTSIIQFRVGVSSTEHEFMALKFLVKTLEFNI